MTAINETIKQQISDNPVLLYMKGSADAPQCGFSAQVCQALKATGVEFATINILEDQALREALKAYSNWPTYPQLYVNGELVGGCDIVMELYMSGELQQMLSAVTAA